MGHCCYILSMAWDLCCRHGLHEDIFNHYIERLLASCDIVQLDAEQVCLRVSS